MHFVQWALRVPLKLLTPPSLHPQPQGHQQVEQHHYAGFRCLASSKTKPPPSRTSLHRPASKSSQVLSNSHRSLHPYWRCGLHPEDLARHKEAGGPDRNQIQRTGHKERVLADLEPICGEEREGERDHQEVAGCGGEQSCLVSGQEKKNSKRRCGGTEEQSLPSTRCPEAETHRQRQHFLGVHCSQLPQSHSRRLCLQTRWH